MKKGMRKLTALFVAFMMSFALFGTSVSAAAFDDDSDLKYVALGDSVSFGLSSVVSLDPVTYRGFADMFSAYLKAVKPSGTTVTFRNLSEIGDNSNDLLQKLLYDGDFQGKLREADVVTINIGANNLLGTMVVAALKAYGYDGDLEELDYNRMYEIMRAKLKANWYSIDKTMLPYSSLANSNDLKVAMNAGVSLFEAQWTTIIGLVRNLAPGAKIIVNRLYNPLAYGDPLYSLLKTYITQINNEIDAKAGLGYKVSDVYNAFRGYEKTRLAVSFSVKNAIMAALVNNISLFKLSLDPHPTTLGHTLIFRQILRQY